MAFGLKASLAVSARREAIGLMRGGVEPAAEGADAETAGTSPAAPRRRRSSPASIPNTEPVCKREAPAVVPREISERQGAEPDADHHHDDRQASRAPCRARAWCRQCRRSPTMTVLLPPASACATAQHQRVAPRKAVVDDDRRNIGDHRHRQDPASETAADWRAVLPGALRTLAIAVKTADQKCSAPG